MCSFKKYFIDVSTIGWTWEVRAARSLFCKRNECTESKWSNESFGEKYRCIVWYCGKAIHHIERYVLCLGWLFAFPQVLLPLLLLSGHLLTLSLNFFLSLKDADMQWMKTSFVTFPMLLPMPKCSCAHQRLLFRKDRGRRAWRTCSLCGCLWCACVWYALAVI